jgi:hypothetical protein
MIACVKLAIIISLKFWTTLGMKIAHANGSILTVKLNFGPSLNEGQVNHSRLESMVQEMSEFLIGAKPSNIQIQKTGAMTPCHPGGPMPASDLERWFDRVFTLVWGA